MLKHFTSHWLRSGQKVNRNSYFANKNVLNAEIVPDYHCVSPFQKEKVKLSGTETSEKMLVLYVFISMTDWAIGSTGRFPGVPLDNWANKPQIEIETNCSWKLVGMCLDQLNHSLRLLAQTGVGWGHFNMTGFVSQSHTPHENIRNRWNADQNPSPVR